MSAEPATAAHALDLAKVSSVDAGAMSAGRSEAAPIVLWDAVELGEVVV